MTKRRKAWVYILECSDGSLYTGWTFDVSARFKAHKEGKGSKYVRARRPFVMVYLQVCQDRGAAMRREAAIKRMSRAEKLRMIKEE